MGTIGKAFRGLVRLLLAVAALAALLRLFRRLQGDHRDAADAPPGWRGPAWLRHMVTNRFNPLVARYGLVGGRRSPWAFVEHVGRKSGTVRRTPILPRVSGDHVVVPLPYGRNANWARNILAAGHCRLQLHEQVYELDEPQVLPATEVSELPSWRRRSLSGQGMEYLRLRVFSVRPGTLDSVGSPTAAEGTAAATPASPVPTAGIDA
jgi:deazaflavin-dependent oxidoreductase (nitroreductase family)